MRFSERYTASLWFPTLYFTHSKIFQTKCMNNLLDRLCYISVDPLVVVVWVGTSVLTVVPQLVLNLGSWLSIFMYYSFVDLDHWMATNLGCEREPPPPVLPNKNNDVIQTRAEQYNNQNPSRL